MHLLPAETFDPDNPEPGMYAQVPDEVYFASTPVSKSGLCIKYLGDTAVEDRTNPNLRIGSAFDLFVQGKENEIYFPGRVDRRTPEGKEEWEKLSSSLEGSIFIRDGSERNSYEIAVQRAKQHYPKVLSAASPETTQVVGVAVDPESGVKIKCKIDQLTDYSLMDWKTTSCTEENEFIHSIWAYNYHMQASMYTDIVKAATGTEYRWYFVAVSKRNCNVGAWIVEPSPQQIKQGRKIYKALLMTHSKIEGDKN